MSEAEVDEGTTAQPEVVLLVDDTPTNLQVLSKTLSGRNYKLLIAKDGETALGIARKAHPSLILLDIMMPGIDGYETCRRLKADPETKDIAVIFCSALDETADKVKGFEIGAVDYVAKPFEGAEVIARVETHLTIQRLQSQLRERNELLAHELEVAEELVEDASARVEGPLLGESGAIAALRRELAALSDGDAPVLLVGPPGAGHEAVARTIHGESPRRRRAFIHVNCLAMGSDSKTTLFGSRGSLLKLSADRKAGKWDLAEGGTLFLDRVDGLSADVQKGLVKKLRESGGRGREARVIAYAPQAPASTAPGTFDPELAELLGGHSVRVPGIADRIDDLPVLVEHFVRQKAVRMGKTIDPVGKRTLKRLAKHRWPGNIDELQSVLECALVASSGSDLEIDDALLDGGERIGRYRLEDKLGEGGMGEVWRAQHELLRRPAAVKLISAHRVADPAQREAALKRFEREAHATATLQSPNTVQLFDFGLSESGDFYYVMELLRGCDLDTLVKQFGKMPVERAVWFLRQACRSLGEAHDAGLVHRDIKPANLFASRLGPEYDFVKVLDFGIVKGMEGSDDVKLTGANIVGSPAFMSPELVMGQKEIDGRSDLYALGCVAYWLIAAKPVFNADTPAAMCVEHATSEPRPLSEVAGTPVPAALEAAVMDCLRKKPEERPETAGVLWQRLGEVELAEPWSQQRAEAWWLENLPDKVRD